MPFEGRASFEGPLSKTPLEGQAASEPYEEPSGLDKPVSGPPSGAEALDEPVTTPNAQLVVVEEEQPLKIVAEPM